MYFNDIFSLSAKTHYINSGNRLREIGAGDEVLSPNIKSLERIRSLDVDNMLLDPSEVGNLVEFFNGCETYKIIVERTFCTLPESKPHISICQRSRWSAWLHLPESTLIHHA